MAAGCEGWIVAGMLDGVVGYPKLRDEVCGVPHVLRLACDLAHAGARRIYVVWNLAGPLPDLAEVAADPRLARAPLEITHTAPAGADDDTVIVARADRLFHRELPQLVLAARERTRAQVGMIRGAENDAVLATDRAIARRLVAQAAAPDGISGALAGASIARVDLPYAGFTASASGPGSLRVAERRLVRSLRKAADGLAAKAINRHLSLPISRQLAGTRILPNHVTLAALVLALIGGGVIATGSYLAGVFGMLFVEAGSIIDGVDGELARLRFQFSRLGQWLDTVVDDVANIAYISGVIVSLTSSGAAWALPIGGVAVGAFILTQATQYALIRFVYKSGDLAAIPWAFQSATFLGERRSGVAARLARTLPKLLKRDFVVTLFLVLAVLGRLDLVLLGWAGGAFAFFGVFFVQLVRNREAVRAAAIS